MLLTSGQISMAISSSVVFMFTFLLFLSGYVLQQQTVRSLQAVIKPQPIVVPPPSPVLAKHFGTPPGHSFYDKYLASNRPKGGWAKVAYVQLVREHLHICNALMLFAVLDEQESMAQRVIMYPKEWDTSTPGALDPQIETSRRLLRSAAKSYKVMLQPVEPMLKAGEQSTFPLAGLLSLTAYNRVIYLVPSGLVLDTSGLDHLFTLPMESDTLGISAGTVDGAASPSVVLLKPSKNAFQTTMESPSAMNYDDQDLLSRMPLLHDLPEDQVHVVAKAYGLRLEDDSFNATAFLDSTSYVHMSDPETLGPEFDAPRDSLASVIPKRSEPKRAWQEVYERYREMRMDVCGLDLEPAPKPGKENLRQSQQRP
ncbi:MAG: hypothetical protein L6R42_005661 [Xanthoria sp. 1 TBL-2021]|nr:MAG: hypothetical protein L6R42_005661 [Xanthoria sp. 1 TBL-2021]